MAVEDKRKPLDARQKTVMPEQLKNLGFMSGEKIDHYLKGVSAAGEILQWRILGLAGECVKDPASKKATDSIARDLLLEASGRPGRPGTADRREARQSRSSQAVRQRPRCDSDRGGTGSLRRLGSGIRATPANSLFPHYSLSRRAKASAPAVRFSATAATPAASRSSAKAPTPWPIRCPSSKKHLVETVARFKRFQSFEIIFFQDRKFASFSNYAHKNGLVLASPDAKRVAGELLRDVMTTGATDPIPGIEGGLRDRSTTHLSSRRWRFPRQRSRTQKGPPIEQGQAGGQEREDQYHRPRRRRRYRYGLLRPIEDDRKRIGRQLQVYQGI